MPQPSPIIPRFPPALGRALRVIPLGPLSLSLTSYTRALAKRHPGMFRRLGEHVSSRFVLDPTDLPICILMEPNGGKPRVRVLHNRCNGDARISGPLAALLGLVHGAYDGDALFFSRDLTIEGDTAAALALRNAIDEEELDLAQECARFSGPFSTPLLRLIALTERRTGLFLSRPEENLSW